MCRVLFARVPVLGLCFFVYVTCFSFYRPGPTHRSRPPRSTRAGPPRARYLRGYSHPPHLCVPYVCVSSVWGLSLVWFDPLCGLARGRPLCGGLSLVWGGPLCGTVPCGLAFTRYSFTPKLSCTSQSSVSFPLHLHCSHYCNMIARLMRNIRPQPDPACVCHTPYTIGIGNIV